MDRLVFNGVRGDTGEYRLPPMTLSELAATTWHEEAPASSGSSASAAHAARALLPFLNGSDLSQAGWGVIFPDDVDPRVREALEPLLEVRRSQAGKLFRELTYSGGTWLEFLEDNGGGLANVDPRNGGLPYYLLAVGSPQEIPFELQYLLDVPYAVGRLSFDSPEGYAAYVRGVLDVEEGRATRPRRVDVFGVHNQDDANTDASERYFVGPLSGALDGHGEWQVRPFRDGEASKARLSRLLGDDSSALLLTVSHGITFLPQDPFHASDQGGLLCNEWPGPGWKQRVPREHYFAAHDVGDEADLRGMISFHFACFSAGTPRLDAFSRAGGKDIPVAAEQDFLSALPRRLLGHPNGGALAVVGHVDQAWTHSFILDGTDRPQIGHFEATFRELMAGKPVGLALEAFALHYGALATNLTQWRERQRESGEPRTDEDKAREALLWQAHNDARGYVLLGDPAVRLPAAPAAGGQG